MTNSQYKDSSVYSRKINYTIKEIDKKKAIELVQANHYSPVMPTLTKHWLGVHRDDRLVGVITLGWGTQPKHTIQKIVSKDLKSEHYYEIGKMCLLESEVKNSETQMISQVIDWLKKYNYDKNKDIIKKNKLIVKENWTNKNNPGYEKQETIPLTEVKFLYTLADGIMGKCGYVYQAANFHYGGDYWTDSYMSSKGEKVHPRTTRQLCFDNWNWHYDENSEGFNQDFKNTYDKKEKQKKSDYIKELKRTVAQIIAETPDDLDDPDAVKQSLDALKFTHDFLLSIDLYEKEMEKFNKSGQPFASRPSEKDFMPPVPKSLKERIKNPKKDYIKKQQVFWLTPDYMKHIGLRKIGGKMFRYIYPLNKEATKILKNSPVDWKSGTGVYPKEEDLKWKELVEKNKSVMLDSMPEWDLSVVEYNEKNVNAHKKQDKTC